MTAADLVGQVDSEPSATSHRTKLFDFLLSRWQGRQGLNSGERLGPLNYLTCLYLHQADTTRNLPTFRHPDGSCDDPKYSNQRGRPCPPLPEIVAG